MSTDDADILRELRLWPRWKLRDPKAPVDSPDVALAELRAAPQVDPTARLAVEREAAAEEDLASRLPDGRTSGDGERLVRIATLGWDAFAADVAACTACKLAASRRNAVPGVGSVDGPWLFVGEAPGADEDAKGEPFVGQAGRLLDAMLAALGLARGQGVYIANVLKCRPPGNRTPEPLEVDACLPYLDRQIALIRPRLIVALGKSAATALLDVDATIGSLRGRVHRYRDVPLIVTYHPAYLLRNLTDKAKAWEDLVLARRTMLALAAAATPEA